MINLFKKKVDYDILYSPVKGKSVSLKAVNDPTFSEEILGKGIAIKASEGKIYSPYDGIIDMVFDTGHAFTITTTFNAEVLVHVGIDTVNMKGDGFISHVTNGQKVKKGDLILTVDLDKISQAGYDDIISMVVCNTNDFKWVEGIEGDISVGDKLITIMKKK